MLVDGLPHLISAAAAGHLQALGADFDLVWCTGWEEKANEYLPGVLGLRGDLPVLSFDRRVGGTRSGHAHWKLAAIEDYAGPDRALAWVDDAFNDACRSWAGERAAPALLVETLPHEGLADEHVRTLVMWARGLRVKPDPA
jgi:hypothetical protein